MAFRVLLLISCLLGTLVLAGCGTDTAAQSSGAADTVVAATPVGAENTTTITTTAQTTETTTLDSDGAGFPAGAQIAGIPVGGFSVSEAESELQAQFAATQILPLTVNIDDEIMTINPGQIDFEVDSVGMLEAAQAQQERGETVDVALQTSYDAEAMRAELQAIAEEVERPASLELLIDEEDTLSRQFAYQPARTLLIDEAIDQIIETMGTPSAERIVTLELVDQTDPAMQRPTFEELEQQVRELADEWEGIAGIYLHDLETGETVSINADTVFSAASVMKVAILLHAYISLEAFDPETQDAINAMIINSDNLRANDVLAATMNGSGTEDAYVGVLAMNKTLSDLGFAHTYMNMPYEGYDFLVGMRGMEIERGPELEGPPPHTAADPILRTTPAEISRIFLMIDECSQGEGQLLARFPQQLSPERCQEMLDLLTQNADDTRLVAGVPEGVRVEHKSGWVQDMHADVGIVRSPEGDYLLAIYLWRGVEELPDIWANPYIVAISQLVYTAYDPVEL